MTDIQTRLKYELKNIFNYSKTNCGIAPKKDSPIYSKYETVKRIIDELEKTNYLESSILRKRILHAKSYETIAYDISYDERQVYRIMKNAESLFVEKAMELQLVK